MRGMIARAPRPRKRIYVTFVQHLLSNIGHRKEAAMTYDVRPFPNLRDLKGLPDALIAAHLKLYGGYVTNTNALLAKLPSVKPSTPEGAELRRRLGWEINGVRLHEYYFEA